MKISLHCLTIFPFVEKKNLQFGRFKTSISTPNRHLVNLLNLAQNKVIYIYLHFAFFNVKIAIFVHFCQVCQLIFEYKSFHFRVVNYNYLSG